MTQNEGFDEVIAEIIDKYLSDYPEENVGHTSTSSDKLSTESETAAADDIPIKQRLRPRVERTQLSSEKRRVNIISNELLPRIVPEATSLPIAATEADLSQQAQVVFIQSGNEMIPVIQSVPSFNASTASVMATTIDSSLTASTVVYQHVLESQPLATTDVEIELPNNEVEKKESTPKITLYPSFLESKSKSTPRRKAQHVRILDFNQTPSTRRLSTIREFSTPANGIPAKTPGSAPATVDVTKSTKKLEDKQLTPALEDDNSNSNSISHTPKVSKKCRRRKIAVQKSEEKMKPGEEDLKKPAAHELTIKTVDDWNNMRSRSKAVPIDQLLRLQNQEVESNAPKKPSRRRRKPVVKTPAKKPRAKKVKEKEKSPSTEIDENKPLSAMKFRISSPRKLMLNKKSSAKKKTVNGATEKCDAQEEVKTAGTTEILNEMNQSAATDAPSELNRSDTVQEVAMVLTNFPETILARHKSTEECETNTQSQADSGICQSLQLETPFKDLISGLNETPFKNLMTPLPNTPRFAIPLSSISQETPMPKIFASSSTVVTLQSLVKNCDIQTPNFPITPGFKLTPLKDLLEVSPASGYMSRRTDYSSSSSYYKPDESEDINQKINEIISQRRDERLSQSESESGYTSVKVVVKKVECPGAIERFTPSKENTEHPVPHYTMMDEGMLSENFVTTATSDSSSSDSSSSDSSCITSCNSSCSSSCPKRPKDKSHNENTMDKLERIANSEEKDSDWQCEDPKMKKDDLISPALVNKTTGEVRFPLRNFITPRKVEIDPERQKLIETNKIKEMLQSKNPPRGLSVEEERAKIIREQEAVKKRTLAKIRKESAASYNQHKYKKSQVKNFKLPAQTVAKPAYVSRKDQILQQQFTERPRPTPLRLIPSTSSSRRKNATPRKTISMNELPREEYSPKKKRTKSETCTKPDTKQSVSFDSQDDNAILPEDSTSLETSNEIELMSPFAAKETTTIASRFDEGSNTFQRTLMDKGFDKNEAKYLQSELIDKLENSVETPALAVEESIELLHQSLLDEKEENNQKEVSLESNEEKAESANEITDGGNREEQDDSSSDEDESEDECLAEENEGRVFIVNEPENFKAVVSMSSVFEILSVKCNLGDREVNLKDTNNIDIFSMNPETTKASKVKKSSPKKLTDDKTNGKASPKKNGKSKSRNSVRWDQSTSGNLKTSPSK